MNTTRGIVTVQYESKMMPGEFGGKTYSYYTTVPLKVGNIVKVPTKSGTSLARVAQIGIEEHRVAPELRKVMRTITKPPVEPPKPSLQPVTQMKLC